MSSHLDDIVIVGTARTRDDRIRRGRIAPNAAAGGRRIERGGAHTGSPKKLEKNKDKIEI